MSIYSFLSYRIKTTYLDIISIKIGLIIYKFNIAYTNCLYKQLSMMILIIIIWINTKGGILCLVALLY